MDANEFQKDKAIDPSQLDVECVRQAETFFKWAERSIEARAEVDRAKFKLEVTESRLEIECRKNPEHFGLGKVTESGIKAAVILHADHREAYKNYIEARREEGLLSVAVQAMDMKKRQLENLITLHGQKYFAGPSVPRDLIGAYVESQKDVEEKFTQRQVVRSRRRGETQ